MRHAELRTERTSTTCIRYSLVVANKVVWRCRVAPGEAGEQLATTRMLAWALRHEIQVTEPASERAS